MQRIELSTHFYEGIRSGQLKTFILPGAQSIALGKTMLVFKGARILPVYVMELSLGTIDKAGPALIDLLKDNALFNGKKNLLTKVTIVNDFESEVMAKAS